MTINEAPPSDSGADASSTFSTTVNPGTGEVTTTETMKIGFHVSDTVFNEVVHEIGAAVTAVSNAVWAGVTDVESFAENVASSFGGWLWRTLG